MPEDTLGLLSKALSVPPHVLHSDVVELAWRWSALVQEYRYVSRKMAAHLLYTLGVSYLRGRDVRMGSMAASRRHALKAAQLVVLVLDEVQSRPAVYQGVVGLGFTDVEAVARMMEEWAEETSAERSDLEQ